MVHVVWKKFSRDKRGFEISRSACFDPNLSMKLTVDASKFVVEAILSHICGKNSERPVVFASKILSQGLIFTKWKESICNNFWRHMNQIKSRKSIIEDDISMNPRTTLISIEVTVPEILSNNDSLKTPRKYSTTWKISV